MTIEDILGQSIDIFFYMSVCVDPSDQLTLLNMLCSDKIPRMDLKEQQLSST